MSESSEVVGGGTSVAAATLEVSVALVEEGGGRRGDTTRGCTTRDRRISSQMSRPLTKESGT